jgi:hypothetical protein
MEFIYRMMIFKDIYVHFSNEICVCLELFMFIIQCTLCMICDMRSSVYMYTSTIRVVINEVNGYLGELAIVVTRCAVVHSIWEDYKTS